MGFGLYPTASWPRKVAGIVIRPMRLIKMRAVGRDWLAPGPCCATNGSATETLSSRRSRQSAPGDLYGFFGTGLVSGGLRVLHDPRVPLLNGQNKESALPRG